ncbi:MAG: Crp/Fnr family transcriptional regulator [Bacteroidales bacterium]
MTDMYDLLLQLPLFQGINRNRLSELIEKTKFHFLKYPAGAKIVSCAEPCTHLKFLISGKIRTELINNNGKIKITEEFQAPNVLAPNFLFGATTHYPYDIFAVENTGIMQIDKATFISLMQNEEIFLLNMLNITSNKSQKTLESFSFFTSGDMKEKLASWILHFTNRRGEEIKIICKQKDLYTFFGVQRTVFLYALNELKNRNIIDFNMREIIVKDRYALLNVGAPQAEEVYRHPSILV